MAGIGFRLQKILAQDSYSGSAKAYAFSALIAAGPFILTVLVVTLIHWVSLERLSLEEQTLLQSLITNGFAFSLVTVGVSLMVVTRFVAAEYYHGHVTHFTAVFFSSFSLHGLVFSPLVLLYLQGFSLSWPVKLNFLLLYLFTSGVWLALIFLSAAKDYERMGRAFLVGAIVSGVAAYVLGAWQGLVGYFGGFVLGQGVTFFLFADSILREFGYKEARDYHWLGYFRRYPLLAGIGFFYNLGIWIDKFLFWVSPQGVILESGLRHAPIYDAPMFFSYLTVVPALAYFLLKMETEFFFKYQAYYRAISAQEGLSALERRRLDMIGSLSYNLKHLLLTQAVISGLFLLCVPWITQATGMDPLQMGILRNGVFAAFLQVGFLIILNFLLYFDLQKEAFISTAVFCVMNGVLTQLSLGWGIPVFGYGYTLACLIALACAFYFLNDRLSRLHYWTFMRQEIPRPIAIIEEIEEEGSAV